MDITGTVELIISGKKYSDVPKSNLISCSGYFKAQLSGNFSDSSKKSFAFPMMSTSAFDILLEYATSKKMNLKAKKVDTICKAVELADFFCIDTFLQDLKIITLTSFTDVESVMKIAVFLNIADEYVENCYEEFKKRSGSSYSISDRYVVPEYFGYDFLILATSVQRLWRFDREKCYDFFFDFMDLLSLLIGLAQRNPPNLKKLKNLLRNLNLECVPWNRIKRLLQSIRSKHDGHVDADATSKVILLSFKQHFSELRQQIINRISCIRICFNGKLSTSRRNYGLQFMEFNLDSWSWEIQRAVEGKFQSAKFCVMHRDYSNIFCDIGLTIVRLKNRNPKQIQNMLISKLCENFDCYSKLVSYCVSGRSIYIHHWLSEGELNNPDTHLQLQHMLFKFDVFTFEFVECASIPLCWTEMVANGTCLYIAGFTSNITKHLSIFCFNTASDELTLLIEALQIRNDPYCDLHIQMRGKMLYAFFQKSYLVVDTSKSGNQPLIVRSLECFFNQSWIARIMQSCATKDGIMFLLNLQHNWYNCDFLGLMLAHFYTDSGVFSSLGFLPNPTKASEWCKLVDPLGAQLERQKLSFAECEQNLDFPEGIEDLENGPHNHSSSYY